MQEYRVELEAYSGPLDLLLYLVRRHEIDLHNIPVARLTGQYLEHLKLIQQIDVELAGEFLVMASTLLEIKSAMLLPKPEASPGGDADSAPSDTDPRYELIQQLLAYKRFKDAAAQLGHQREQWETRYRYQPVRQAFLKDSRVDALPDGTAPQIEIDLEDASVMDLYEAYQRVMESVGQQPAIHEVVYDDTPISLHAEDIVDRLTREGAMSLQEIFVGRASRSERIGLFLAMLELVRRSRITIRLDGLNQKIHMELQPESDAVADDPQQAPDWRDPETGAVQYDWPDEEARLRAERRVKLRASRAAAGQSDTDDSLTDDDTDLQIVIPDQSEAACHTDCD